MAGLNESGAEGGLSTSFIVDRSYLKQQAGEAFRTFIAPLAGVYGAAVGSGPAAPQLHRDGSGKKRA